MVNVWERFGVKSISPSQINKFNDEPALWFAGSIRRAREDAGPAAWRGDAVEFGLYSALMGKPTPGKEAERTFEERSGEWSSKHDGEVHPDHDDEFAKIEVALARAIAAMDAAGYGMPVAYQLAAEGYLPGCDKIRFFSKPDFIYEGFTLDLKTSGILPSRPKDGSAPEAKPDHAMAFAIYASLRGDKCARGLYVSTAAKPSNPYVFVELNENQIETYINHAVRTIKAMERRMTAALALSEYECVDPMTALAELCSPNLLARGGGLYPLWKEEYTRTAAEAVPEWGIY